MTSTEVKIEIKDKVFSNFDFSRVSIRKTTHRYIVHQSQYAVRLKEQPQGTTYDEFRTLRHKLAWLSLTRPDICAAANISSQITNDTFTRFHIKHMNKLLRRIQKTKTRGLRFHMLV